MLQLVACRILGNCLDVIGCGGRRVAIEGASAFFVPHSDRERYIRT